MRQTFALCALSAFATSIILGVLTGGFDLSDFLGTAVAVFVVGTPAWLGIRLVVGYFDRSESIALTLFSGLLTVLIVAALQLGLLLLHALGTNFAPSDADNSAAGLRIIIAIMISGLAWGGIFALWQRKKTSKNPAEAF